MDRLCARAQRGITRRSFCFLFGAGIAGAVASPSLLAHQPARIGLDVAQLDDITVLLSAWSAPKATFKTTEAYRPSIGQAVTINSNGMEVFSGVIHETKWSPDGGFTVSAHDPTWKQFEPDYSRGIVDPRDRPLTKG